MSFSITGFLRSLWESAGQLPLALGGFEEDTPKAEALPLAKTMGNMPLVETSGIAVPKDLIQMFFRRLPPKEVLKAGLVCRLWYQIASSDSLWNSFHLREVFPRATYIDKNIWDTYVDTKKYGLDMEMKGRPCVSKWDYIDLRRMELEIEGDLSFTVIMLPKGHKLNDTIDFAGSGKMGNSTAFGHIWDRIIEVLGTKEIEETIIVAVTNNVFKDSRKESIANQQKLVEKLRCEMPGILAAMDVVLMRFRISDPATPIRLFGDDPWTYTRLAEMIDKLKLVFGGFALGGPDASLYAFAGGGPGVGGQRKFKVIL